MKVRFGFRDLEFPSGELGQLRESNDPLGDVSALWQRMDEDGYLLLRGLIERETVLAARELVREPHAGTAGIAAGLHRCWKGSCRKADPAFA